MNMNLQRSLRERKRFTDLDPGELFVFNVNDTVYVKIDNRRCAFPVPPPSTNGSYPAVLDVGIGPRLFYRGAPTVIIGNPELISPPPIDFPPSFGGSTGANPYAYPGSDPILGFPYSPLQYQLFIDSLTSDQFLDSSVPVHLHWTLPNLNLIRLAIGFPATQLTRVYVATSNNINLSWSFDSYRNQFFRWIYPTNYVWALNWVNGVRPLKASAGSGTVVPGGDTFNGHVTVTSGLAFNFATEGARTIDHLVLRRGVNNMNNPTVLSSSIAPGTLTYDDTSTRVAGENYFYDLSAILTGDSTHPIPFNNVGLIHPYDFWIGPQNSTDPSTANPNANPRYLHWNAPDPTQWPTTPADLTVPFPPFAASGFYNTNPP